MLVKLASECWAALHPAKAPGKAKAKPANSRKKKAAIVVSDDDDGPAQDSVELDVLFRNMLVNDDALYARILRYEPLPFDELASRAIAAGVSERGWRPRLKRFLDLKVSWHRDGRADYKGVTYFTSDPTAPRRRY